MNNSPVTDEDRGYDVFLSYAHEEKPKAEALAKALQSCGYSVWWDPHIPPGKVFSQVIEAELRRARCVIVLWTRVSVRSEWVEIEAAKAKARGVLVPVLLEEVAEDIPLEFSRMEAANLVGWRPGDASPEWETLVDAVGRLAGRDAAPPKFPAQLLDDSRPRALRWMKYSAALFAFALLAEFLIGQRLFTLREIGNAAQLYGRELVFDLALVGLLWALVAWIGCYAGLLAKRAGLQSWSMLAWAAGSVSFIAFLFALVIDSQRYSDGPSFPFPYYAVVKESNVYHFMLAFCLALIGGWLAFRSRKPRNS